METTNCQEQKSPSGQVRRLWASVGVLVVLCAFMLLPGLGRVTMLRQQELRVVLTARDMAQGGSWLVPHFRGEPRLRKPPLMYWIDAVAQKVSGAYTSPAAARMPSVLAGTALVISLFLFGRRWMSSQAAFLSALACSSMMLFLRFARLAETDITLTLFTTLACGTAYRALSSRRHASAWWILTGVMAGLGFMTKGPAALILPLAAVLAFALSMYLIARKAVLTRQGLHAIWVFALVALPWYAYIWNYAQSQAAIGNEIQEAFIAGDHPGTVFYYFYKLPLALMPWGLLLPFAVVHAWRQQRQRVGIRFILWWWITTLAILTLIPNKQEHYANLLIPSSALLIGYCLSECYVLATSRQSHVIHAYLMTVAIGLALSGLVVAMWLGVARDTWSVPTLFIGVVMLAFGVMGCRPRQKNHPLKLICACVLLMGWLGMLYAFVLHPLHDPQSLIPPFVKSSMPFIRHADRIYVQGSRSEAIEYYAGRPLIETSNAAETWRHCRPGDLLILSAKKNRPLPITPLPQPPDVATTRRSARCVLLRK
ncbi:MAG: glycosyltransferase family 39 protein [Spartobacteria bacterium]|nr:glycosyltransferase family 39 protein [Spartobacteria bacterium]